MMGISIIRALAILSGCCAGLVLLSFAAYSYTTGKIIKDKDREIARLKTENARLKKRLQNE